MTQDAATGSLLSKIAIYTELLAKDPCSSIFVPLSDAYRQLGMFEEAAEIVQNGILENPAFAEGYAAYARILVAQEMLDEAVGEYEKALILDKNRLSALKPLAKIRFDQGDFKAARTLLQRAAEFKSDDGSVRKMLESIEQALAKPVVEAVAAVPAAEVETADPIPEDSAPPSMVVQDKTERISAPISTATIAEIYIRQGFPEKALKVYRDLLRADPLNEVLREKLVQLKLQLDSASSGETEVIPAAVVKTVSDPVSTPPEESVAASLGATPAYEQSNEEPDKRSLGNVFNGWLDAISRRREAHVQ